MRRRNNDEFHAIDAAPARAYAYLLEFSTIGPVRRSGLLD